MMLLMLLAAASSSSVLSSYGQWGGIIIVTTSCSQPGCSHRRFLANPAEPSSWWVTVSGRRRELEEAWAYNEGGTVQIVRLTSTSSQRGLQQQHLAYSMKASSLLSSPLLPPHRSSGDVSAIILDAYSYNRWGCWCRCSCCHVVREVVG